MTRGRIAAAAVVFALVAAGSGAAMGAARHSHRPPRALFAGQLLLPGKNAHSDITVRGASIAVRPYLEISDIRQHCVGTGCAARQPALAPMLRLSATDGAGHTWNGPLTSTRERIELPGGIIPARRDRTYHLTLSMSGRAGNSYEGLSVTGHVSWGGTDATGAAVTASDPQQGGLPFTGFDVLAALAVAGLLLSAGGVLVETAKRRRPPQELVLTACV